MQAESLDRRALRDRRATQLRDQLVADYDIPRHDADRLSLEALFELRWRLLNRMMQPGYGR